MRNILYFISFIFLVNSLILVGRKSFTLGLAIMFCISAGLFALAKWMDLWLMITSGGVGYFLRCVIIAGVCMYLLLTGYVLSFAHSTVDYSENVIIVLGCGLNSDGTPGPTLTKRLDGCVTYLKNNPDCYVAVSGGYSRFNNMTEGRAMKKYLTEKGVNETKILVDEKATNTRENFKNIYDLLKSENISAHNICYVTNSFHVYRAGVYARREGFSNVKAVSTDTDYAIFIPAVLREVIGVAMMMIFNY